MAFQKPGRKKYYCESCNKSNESHNSTEIIEDFMISGDISNIDLLVVSQEPLVKTKRKDYVKVITKTNLIIQQRT